jgi:hypothetical protein
MELIFKVEDFPVRVDPFIGVPNKNSRKYKAVRDAIHPEYIYTWEVCHYEGWEDDPFMLTFQPDMRTFPSAGIITSEAFISNLNQWKCFGNLDYLPLEGDCVVIKYCSVEFATKWNPDHPNLGCEEWMQSIYRNGKWVREKYYHAKLETVAKGIVYTQ